MTPSQPSKAVGTGAELRRSSRKVLSHARERPRIADVQPLSGHSGLHSGGKSDICDATPGIRALDHPAVTPRWSPEL